MKPKRKVSPRSFVMKVAGAGGPSGGGIGGLGQATASDHDLAHPAAHGGAAPGNDSDSGPQGGGGR